MGRPGRVLRKVGKAVGDEVGGQTGDAVVAWVVPDEERPNRTVSIDTASVRAAAAKLRQLADDFGDIGAKVGEGYANRSSFGKSTEAKQVAKNWNDAVDARQSEIKDLALRLSRISNALDYVWATWEGYERLAEDRIKELRSRMDNGQQQLLLGVTDEERDHIRDGVRGRDQQHDQDGGAGAGGDQDGGAGD